MKRYKTYKFIVCLQNDEYSSVPELGTILYKLFC